MTSQAGRKNFPSAFSLVELIVVMVIMLIVVAISLPYFTSYGPKRKLEGAARELTSAIRTARGYAITNNANYTFNFYSISTGRYRIDDPGSTLEETYSLPEGITVTAPATASMTVVFTPSGSVSGANPPTITLQNADSDTRDITIINTTGRAEIS